MGDVEKESSKKERDGSTLMPDDTHSDSEKDYLLAEATIFNNHVIWYLEQQQKQEIFALGATGLLWAYLLKGEGEIFSLYVALVPPVIAGVLYAKNIIMTKAMNESMSYLETLENSFKLKDGLGWIHYYKKHTSNYKRRWRNYFWRGLLIANVVISTAFLYQNLNTDKKAMPKQMTQENVGSAKHQSENVVSDN